MINRIAEEELTILVMQMLVDAKDKGITYLDMPEHYCVSEERLESIIFNIETLGVGIGSNQVKH